MREEEVARGAEVERRPPVVYLEQQSTQADAIGLEILPAGAFVAGQHAVWAPPDMKYRHGETLAQGRHLTEMRRGKRRNPDRVHILGCIAVKMA